MVDPLARWKNADGVTYSGVRMLSDLTGIPEEEVAWTAKRMQELLREGATKVSAVATINLERKNKPWLKNPT